MRKTVFFAGKAAPGYFNAKCIIRLICGISEVLNADAETNHYLKVFFVPNYNVSLAEMMIPASDLSQHISTAGMEASGTSNMKFIMNGGVIIGTLDGANVEISEQVQVGVRVCVRVRACVRVRVLVRACLRLNLTSHALRSATTCSYSA